MPDHTPTSETEVREAASELRVVLGQLVRRLRTTASLPFGQVAVLGRIMRDGPHTTSGLAAAERMRPQSMAQTVKELELAGLIERRPDPEDRRQVLLDLTEAGREAILAERRSREGWLADAMCSRLDAEEQATLVRAVELLRRLAQS